MQELHRAGGNGDYTLGGHTQGHTCMGPSRKQYLQGNLGYTYLGVLEGSLGSQRSIVTHSEGKDTDSRSPREY